MQLGSNFLPPPYNAPVRGVGALMQYGPTGYQLLKEGQPVSNVVKEEGYAYVPAVTPDGDISISIVPAEVIGPFEHVIEPSKDSKFTDVTVPDPFKSIYVKFPEPSEPKPCP